VETDRPTDIGYLTSVFAAFEFKREPVVDVMDAVRSSSKPSEYPRKTFRKPIRADGQFLKAT
jgi:hypothetical protein